MGINPARISPEDGVLERTQYETCDALHQVIERLQLLPRPIYRLDVSIFINQYDKREPALEAAHLFLKSFRDLRNVLHPTVDSVVWANNGWENVNLFNAPTNLFVSPTEILSHGLDGDDGRDQTFAGFVQRWKAGISRPGPAPDVSPVVYAYWVLHHICFDLQIHHEAAKVVESNTKIDELLLRAKKAREAEDMCGLRVVSQEIQAIWKRYQEKQRIFESRVVRNVQFVDGLLGWDDLEWVPQISSTSTQEYEGKGKGRAEDVDGPGYGASKAGPS
jgi:hypothetical protein